MMTTGWHAIPDSNAIYMRVVTDRVLRLRHEVMAEFQKLGFSIYTSSGFLHEATIQMAQAISDLPEEEAKQAIRPIIKRWVMHD